MASTSTLPPPQTPVPEADRAVQEQQEQRLKDAIHLNIPQRMMVLPTCAFIVGAALGITRGGRNAGLRFLAENAHNPPTTVQGWYFYNKTKNYKVILGGLKAGGAMGGLLGGLGLVYTGLEEGLGRAGSWWAEGKHMGAGVGTALAFSGLWRLPMKMVGRNIMLGGVVGVLNTVLDRVVTAGRRAEREGEGLE
ncbi:hypothetical protein D9619_000973 [Psilocybe cf. subviscida]|uniref:Uncharacterized protein n=1 Tax=Psilocybe cf. subviscida TaxID=2480587 RepID=A0A8H5BG38_9AGAR|nr:hypothetical protein D9619_000973 [Psilocybe cf. subviscida]